eukprot:TRINITY_DN19691_c0_g1_i1.p2 TRINITY_DN19691_c0_g1~~TRINITY_DN19691_c0_g1_i1.p2  ORF type:complete len:280 (-),score=11.39 TRINITY_DN19691_c0_g1_i1:143-982(-)
MEFSESTKDFVAGGIAGGLGVLVGQPLDTIRVRIQQANVCNYGSSVIGCYIQTVRKEGFFGLYRGITYPLATIAFQNAIVFQSRGFGARFLYDDNYSNVAVESLAGMFAGVMQVGVMCPIEVLKIRLQVQKELPGSRDYLGAVPMFFHILKNQGVKGFYNGFTITAIRDVPSFGVYFAVYEALKSRINATNLFNLLMAGGIAGVISWAVIYPFDVVKSRMQSGMYSQQLTWQQCMVDCYKKEGMKALVRGIGACSVRAFCVNAVIFVAYEYVIKLMAQK